MIAIDRYQRQIDSRHYISKFGSSWVEFYLLIQKEISSSFLSGNLNILFLVASGVILDLL